MVIYFDVIKGKNVQTSLSYQNMNNSDSRIPLWSAYLKIALSLSNFALFFALSPARKLDYFWIFYICLKTMLMKSDCSMKMNV